MSDVLKGMTTAEARALVGRIEAVEHGAIEWEDDSVTPAVKVVCESPEDVDKLLALAALGARVVGAREAWTTMCTVISDSPESDLRSANVEFYPKRGRRVLILPEVE